MPTNTRIISLNLCRYKYPKDREVILKWTEERLKEYKGDWVFVTHHYAMNATARNRNEGLRFPEFKALYEKYKVPLVLTGHEHLYARGRIGDRFPVYVISVAGPYQNAIQFGDWIERAGTSLQLFQEIDITPDTIHYATKTVAGEVYDEFSVVKNNGKLSYIVNHNLEPESLIPPPDFEERYNKTLVDSWDADRKAYLSRKEKK